jgi:hypothetical protein
MDNITEVRVELSALKALGGQCFFAIVYAYLKARAVDGVARVPNKEAAALFGVTPRYITSAITHLRQVGLITHYEYDGRNRIVHLIK